MWFVRLQLLYSWNGMPLVLISHGGRARCPNRAAANWPARRSLGAGRTDGALGQTRSTARLLATAAGGEKSKLGGRRAVAQWSIGHIRDSRSWTIPSGKSDWHADCLVRYRT